MQRWSEFLLASRETPSLRQEESNRVRTFYQLLRPLLPDAGEHEPILNQAQSGAYSFACQRWGIPYDCAAQGML